MEPGRPLREAFAELVSDDGARSAYATDADGFLGAYGHADLPDSLLAEAIVNFAESSSPEVAEHLAPFVMAHTGVVETASEAGLDPAAGLDLLSTAPVELEPGDVTLDDIPEAGAFLPALDDEPSDLDFGAGVMQDEPATEPAEERDAATPADELEPQPAGYEPAADDTDGAEPAATELVDYPLAQDEAAGADPVDGG